MFNFIREGLENTIIDKIFATVPNIIIIGANIRRIWFATASDLVVIYSTTGIYTTRDDRGSDLFFHNC